MDPLILKVLENGVLTLSFNRPDRRNAWATDLEDALRLELDLADANPAVRVIILTGAGSTFCPGPAPGALARASGSQRRPESPEADLEQRYSYMLGLRKPLIAAINGAAAGVGFCITLYCDLRFIVEDARITTAFTRRGLVAEHGSAWMLPRLIGPMHATDLLLTGRVITGAEAQAMGLARALPRDGFLRHVQAFAADMALSCSPRSLAVVKRQLGAALRQTLAEATCMAAEETSIALSHPDLEEGIAHFVEKRRPRFRDLV